jgi:hypothetical protein
VRISRARGAALLVLALTFCARTVAATPSLHVSAAEASLASLTRDVPIAGRVQLDDVALDTRAARVSLQLERFQVFAPDAWIEVHADGGVQRVPAPDNAYWRGRLVDEPDSWAVLSVRAAGNTRGLVRAAGQVWVLESDSAGRLASRLVAAPTELADQAETFDCRADALAAATGFEPARAEEGDAATPPQPNVRASATARLAIETDFEFLQRFSGSTTAATDYVGDLVGYASTVYASEIDTTLLVQSLSLWTTASDPWAETNPTCGLYEFGRYWNDNRAGVSRTLAHFLSGKTTTAGIAWVGVLCAGAFNVNLGTACPSLTPRISNWGGGYGYTGGISGAFNLASPGVLWDIVAMAHEIGHNFNSPHTHCYGNLGGEANPIDACSASQAGQTGCYSGLTSLPGVGALSGGSSGQRNGTLMSYCHLLGGGFGNIAMTFGTGHTYGIQAARAPQRMRAHVVATAASQPACLAFTAPIKGDFDGDQKTDLVFRETATNAAFLWRMDGVTRFGGERPLTPVPATNLRLVASDDFNGDQRTDLVYQNTTTGAVEFWLMKSGTARWGAPVALTPAFTADWTVVASADFNADGKADLLWRNRLNQKLRVWTLNGTAKLGEITPSPDAAIDANWQVVAAFDADRNNTTDLLWFNTSSGNIVFWYMNAAVVRTAGGFTTPTNAGDNNWKVVASGDYGVGPGGQAGTNDIVWRNDTSGRIVVWYMNVSGVRTSGTFTVPDAPGTPLAMTVVAPR